MVGANRTGPVRKFGVAPDAWQRPALGRLRDAEKLLWFALLGLADRSGLVGTTALRDDIAWLLPDMTEEALGVGFDALCRQGLAGYATDGSLRMHHHGDLWRTVAVRPTRTSLSKTAAYRHLYLDPCAYCGTSAQALDHIFPLALGGGDEDGLNLTAACRACNSRKGSRSLLHFLIEAAS